MKAAASLAGGHALGAALAFRVMPPKRTNWDKFRVLPHGSDARGGCALPRPCPHAVAAALAWVRTGEEEQLPGLFELLRVQDRDWLAARLAELAAADPTLAARLLDEAEDADAAGAAAGPPRRVREERPRPADAAPDPH